MGKLRRAVVHAAIGASALVGGSEARAQGAVPGEAIAQARVLGNEGIRLADAGDCAAAIPKLEGAEQLYHAPTTLERLGECLVSTGKVVAGAEALLRVSRETLPAGAPAQFVAAQERAQKAVGAAQGRIAQLNLHVDGAPASSLHVTIDGSPVVVALLDTDRPTDPGAHELKVAADGFDTATQTVTLADGEHKKLAVTLTPAAAPPPVVAPVPAPAPQGAPAPAIAPQAPPSEEPNRTPAYVAYGIGGVGLVVGTVFGVMALGTHSTLADACNPKTNCPASSQSDIDSLSTKAWVANAGFAVAIVGAGVGTYLLLTSGGGGASAAASTARVRVTPYLAGTGGGITGSF